MKSWACWLLCALGIVFPFSVAGSNILLGSTLAVGIVSGIWWTGVRHMWTEYRGMSIAMLTYWGLMLIGLAWSSDRIWGLHVLGHQWFWLAVPVVVTALGQQCWRERFLAFLSLGLMLHLGYCVLQKFSYVHLAYPGSSADDATGFVGHISFGFIYGIWAGWLLHWGWKQSGWKRRSAWLLAAWAWVMIFAAQGRGGYIVALAIMVVVLWRHWIAAGWRRVVLPLALVAVMIGVLAAGPGKERLILTWNNMTGILHGDVNMMSSAGVRWVLLIGAVDAWKNHPILGVGTGGYPNAAEASMRAHPGLMISGSSGIPIREVHPHNMYLFSLARWGLFGLAVYLSLVATWVRTGWKIPWDQFESPIMALAGIALALDGLFAPTLEQYHSGVMLVMLLGLQLAAARTAHIGTHDGG